MSAKNAIYYTRGTLSGSTPEDGLLQSKPETYESRWHLCRELGAGTVHKLRLRAGFNIWLTDCKFNGRTTFFCEEFASLVSFSFVISGHSRGTLFRDKKVIEMAEGQQGIFYMPDPNGYSEANRDWPLRNVCIQLSRERFASLVEDDFCRIPESLKGIFHRKAEDTICRINDITPAMRVSLQQMFDCPFNGMTRKLYLESRAIELIAHQFDLLYSLENRRAKAKSLHPDDVKRADLARSLLVRDIENPPGLLELASSVGMSHTKLNRCFRKMYGMTTFQYLRNERLNQARDMLDRQRMNVTETAYAVGYASLSHFAKAYKKQFGISPGACHTRD